MITSKDRPCECGSGRKYRNCCAKKTLKPRKQTIEYEIEENIKAFQIRVDDNGLSLIDDNGRTIEVKSKNITASYDRNSTKRKVLFDYSGVNSAGIPDVNRELTKYDLLYAIDTNTKLVKDKKISMTAILTGIKIEQNSKYTTYSFSLDVIEFESENNICTDMVIIVDSDLGNIRDYNERKLPIIDNFFLPENVKLVYASADVGQEYLPNKLIKECDRFANEYMNEILRNV